MVDRENFGEKLYQLLPKIYHEQDLKALNPEPLRRFLQVTSLGLDTIDRRIDAMHLIFNIDFTPVQYLDPIGRMLGFDFRKDTTEEEKRRIIKNLPTLYKLKGNTIVFEMLARIMFHEEAKAEVDWIYSDSDSGVKLEIELEVGDFITDMQGKMDRYNYLAEKFRPVNVGYVWKMLVFYYEEVFAKVEEKRLDVIYINDGYQEPIYDDVNVGNLPFQTMWGGNVGEVVSLKGTNDELVDGFNDLLKEKVEMTASMEDSVTLSTSLNEVSELNAIDLRYDVGYSKGNAVNFVALNNMVLNDVGMEEILYE